MPAEERRTLSIQARVKDFASGQLRTMGRSVTRFSDLATRDFRRITRGVQRFQGVFAGLVGFLSVRAGVSAFRNIANDIDEIVKQSDKLQLTTDSIQELQFVAKIGGTSFETLARGYSQFTRQLDLARQGSRQQLDALRDIGIRLEDLPLGPGGKVDIIELLADASEGFNRLEDRTRAAAVANILFSRGGRELGAILTSGAAGLREQAQQFERLSGVIRPEDLQRAAEFNDSVVRIQTAFQGLGRRLFLEFAPGLTAFLNDSANRVADWRMRLQDEIGSFTLNALEFLKGLQVVLGPVLVALGTRIDIIVAQIGAAITAFQGARVLFNTFSFDFDAARGAFAELQGALDLTTKALGRIVEIESELNLAGKIEAEVERITNLIASLREDVEPPAKKAGDTAGAAFGDGFITQAKMAFAEFTDLTAFARQSAQSLVRGGLDRFSGALTSIITRTKSAKEAFAEFGRATLQTLTQLLVKLLLIKGLSLIPGVGGLVGGGLFERGGIARGDVKKTIPIRQYQRGGIARGPQIAVFGEGSARRGEAFVPLPDGRNIPVVLSGGGGSTFNFHIQAMDGQDVHRVLVRNRASIMSIWSHQVSHRNNVRQTLRRAAS